MKDLETLRGAAVILTGMAASLNAIADMEDIATPDPKTTGTPLAMTEMPIHPSVIAAAESNVVDINTAATSGVEVDKDGNPWDHRIHTSTKKQTQKGIWKRRPGIVDEEFNRIVAELKATMAAPGPAVTEVPAPPVTIPPVVEQIKTMTEKAGGSAYQTFIDQGWKDADLVVQGYMVLTDAVAEVPAPPVTAVPQPPVTQAAGAMSFPELAALVTPAIKANVITQAEADAEAGKAGIESIALMVSRGDLVPTVYASCQQLILSRTPAQ